MTITELTERLNKYGYHITSDPFNHNWVITDDADTTVATIDNTKERAFGVYDGLPNNILYTCVIHFANTPIKERTANQTMHFELTPTEITALSQLHISIASPTIMITNEQLHALRHMKKQLNHQLSKK